MLKFKHMHVFYQDLEFQIYSLPLLITTRHNFSYQLKKKKKKVDVTAGCIQLGKKSKK